MDQKCFLKNNRKAKEKRKRRAEKKVNCLYLILSFD